MMKVAIPIFNKRVSPVFDWCRNLLLLEISPGGDVKRREVELDCIKPEDRARRLVDLEAGMLVCGGISEQLLTLVESMGIRVIPGVAGGIDDVLEALMEGNLPQPHLMMPGCKGHGGRRRLRRGGGGRGRRHGRR